MKEAKVKRNLLRRSYLKERRNYWSKQGRSYKSLNCKNSNNSSKSNSKLKMSNQILLNSQLPLPLQLKKVNKVINRRKWQFNKVKKNHKKARLALTQIVQSQCNYWLDFRRGRNQKLVRRICWSWLVGTMSSYQRLSRRKSRVIKKRNC